MEQNNVSEKKATNRRWGSRLAMILALLIVTAFVFSPPWSVLGKADLVGYGICHRLPERSFFLAGQQLPLCARCSGIYLGSLLAFAIMGLVWGKSRAGNLPPVSVLAVLVGFIVVMGIDGINSYLTFFPTLPHLYEPSNFLRMVTGTLNGLALSAIVFPVFNFTLWKDTTLEHSIDNFRELALLLVMAAVLIGVVVARIDFLLYPLAILSAVGVLVMLTAVNTMIVLIVLRREGMAVTWGDAALPLLMGLLVSLLELAGMDLLRLALTRSMGLPL